MQKIMTHQFHKCRRFIIWILTLINILNSCCLTKDWIYNIPHADFKGEVAIFGMVNSLWKKKDIQRSDEVQVIDNCHCWRIWKLKTILYIWNYDWTSDKKYRCLQQLLLHSQKWILSGSRKWKIYNSLGQQ